MYTVVSDMAFDERDSFLFFDKLFKHKDRGNLSLDMIRRYIFWSFPLVIVWKRQVQECIDRKNSYLVHDGTTKLL